MSELDDIVSVTISSVGAPTVASAPFVPQIVSAARRRGPRGHAICITTSKQLEAWFGEKPMSRYWRRRLEGRNRRSARRMQRIWAYYEPTSREVVHNMIKLIESDLAH